MDCSVFKEIWITFHHVSPIQMWPKSIMPKSHSHLMLTWRPMENESVVPVHITKTTITTGTNWPHWLPYSVGKDPVTTSVNLQTGSLRTRLRPYKRAVTDSTHNILSRCILHKQKFFPTTFEFQFILYSKFST